MRCQASLWPQLLLRTSPSSQQSLMSSLLGRMVSESQGRVLGQETGVVKGTRRLVQVVSKGLVWEECCQHVLSGLFSYLGNSL